MGIAVLVMGESGSGKSSSLRNFEQGQVGILNVAGKPLPFRKHLPMVNNATYKDIFKFLNKPKSKAYVIDDSQYLMAFESLSRAKETGYTKFTEMALNFTGLVRMVNDTLPPDVIVYFLHHTEISDVTGRTKAKTVGKMIDNQVTLEGLFPIVLLATRDMDGYCFRTQTDGTTTAKSPMGMFDERIDNDLAFVDKTIREYWDLTPNTANTTKED